MQKMNLLGLSTWVFLFAVPASADELDINKIYSPWCYTEMEYKDGDRSKEKATYTFFKDNTLHFKDFIWDTTSSYEIQGTKIKTEKWGNYNIQAISDEKMVLTVSNGAIMYLNKGKCS